MKKFMYLLLISFLWGACSENIDMPTYENNTENIPLTLVITVPASTTYVRSRGISTPTDHESLINEIQVLVFESGKYKYRVPGISIHNNSISTSFNVLLKSSQSPLKLIILANATNAVTSHEPSENDSEEDIKKKINQNFDNITSDFPMYGEYNLSNRLTTNDMSSISGIKMLRSIARIDVKATEVPNFKLTGVKAYRANKLMQIIPNETGILKVTTPSIPENSNKEINSSLFTITDEDLNEFSARLYLPESQSPAEADRTTQATCIIVEGYYDKNTQPCYYRMDFDPDNKQQAFGQILRNHKYIFNIKKVLAPGWNSADEAANNRSSHIVAEIQAWDDDTIDMSFDGTHHFGVSTRELVIRNKAGSNGTVYINTDLPDYTLQWADAEGTPLGNGSQSLTNEHFTVNKIQSGNQLVVTALQNNSSNNYRSQNFIVTAQRWRILINVRQGSDVAAYTTISLLTFNAGLGYLGTNLVGSANAESRATGLRGMLANRNNFGPDGTVECGGYNLIGTSPSNNNLSEIMFNSFDVIYVHYMSNGLFGSQDAQKVHNWVKAKKNRVLIVSYDASDVSQNLLNEILRGNTGINYLTRNTGPYPLANQTAQNSYFTTTGPFTTGTYSPLSPSFAFQNYDIYHGEIKLNTTASQGITPILMGPEGGITLGIDYSRRIVYWGDTDLSSALPGTGSTKENHISNNSGNIDNDASKLLANVFAWVTETVLYNK